MGILGNARDKYNKSMQPGVHSAYSFAGVNKVQLAINLGLGYDQLVRYRPDNMENYLIEKDYIENTVYGGDDDTFLLSTLTGLPILNRYAEISYKDDTIKFDKSLILETLFITCERTKNITKNICMGINGSIKEFVNSGDHIITITGSIASNNKWLYPEDQLRDFIDLCNAEDSINISNDYLNKLWGVDSIVVETFSLAQSEKFSNIVLYTMNCLSDFSTNKIIVNN